MINRFKSRGHGSKNFPLKRNYCFACGKDNPDGMHLKFTFDREHKRFVSNFRVSKRFTGPPGHCHGGIIATILDDAMSKLNKLRDITAATAELKINYLKPVPLGRPLRAEAWELRKSGRTLIRSAEIFDESGTLLAAARGMFVIINPSQVFKRK